MKEPWAPAADNSDRPNQKSARGLAGWQEPLPETLPKPTVWPVVLALGACLLAGGIVTSWIVSGAGFILFVIGCGGWIAEMRHQPR